MKNKSKITLLLEVVIHAILVSGLLVLAYNTYKEYVRGPNNIYTFPFELKVAIKSTFQWEVLVFVILYVLYSMLVSEKGKHTTLKKYFIIITLYALFTNLFFLSSAPGVLTVLNLSILYLVIFLLVFCGIILMAVVLLSAAPCVVSIFLQRLIDRLRGYVTGNSSKPFVIGFILLLAMCLLLMVLKQEHVAEGLANVAYVFLVIGVVKEVCRMIRYGEKDEHV